MNYIGKFISNFKDAYNEINGATLTGAIDAVVVHQEDGSFLSSPFHVRFGKIGVLRSREKVVDIEINGEPVDIRMKLGETGEAFFVEELEDGDEVCPLLGTSPLPNYLDCIPNEDDQRSLDSGVEAEEVTSKSLKNKQLRDRGQNFHDFIISCDNNVKNRQPHRATNQASLEVFCNESDCNPVSEKIITAKLGSNTESQFTLSTQTQSSSTYAGISPSVDIAKQSSWRDDLVRSKSLTNESPFMKISCIVLDGQESKTDIEETIRVSRATRRRKKRKASRRVKPIETNHSSDNSTTSETVDLSSLSVSGIVSSSEPMFCMDDLENQHLHNSSLVHDEENEGNEIPKKSFGRQTSNGIPISIVPDFHPFSDTDISPPPSLNNSRSATPVKSDTEYEYEKQKNEMSQSSAHNRDDKWSWTWGELPTPPAASRSKTSSRQGHNDSSKTEKTQMQTLTQAEDDQRSMLGNMLSFMRVTKKARHNPQGEGIYLDDLKLDELDPEVAALYFPKNSLLRKSGYTEFRSVAKDEDVESGNGTSLPQSPHSVEGAIGGAKISSLDSDFEDSTRHPIFDYKGYQNLAFSLCGGLHDYIDNPFPESLFLQSLLTYDDFCENPNVIDNPDLVVRLGSKYMNWGTAAAQIIALALFQRPLPAKVMETLAKENMPKKEMRKRTESRGYSWFSWRRNTDVESEQKSYTNTESLPQKAYTNTESLPQSVIAAAIERNIVKCPAKLMEENIKTESLTEATPAEVDLSELSSRVERHLDESPKRVMNDPIEVPDMNDSSDSEGHDFMPRKRYRKTIRLSSDQIKKLNLRSGSNEVVFSVTTAYQGTTKCKCHIFLWNYDEKIVVSDIDGTITKSDVLGHILPIIGKDWAQGGVAQLFTKIKNNGYNFLYLSARAIGQARITRDYLRSIKQGDVSLPDGPLLLNPTSLIQAFHREVIEKKPEEFKISCLRDIKALFPSHQNPFYAGYGNKVNDVWAYSAVGIPIQRIFTINHRGELKHEMTQTFQSTYSSLTDIAHHMFPPAHERENHDEFSSFHFWKFPLPDLSNEIDEMLS